MNKQYKHEHHFNQHKPKAGEIRTRWVIILTAITMTGEIIAGLVFGSMALLADGLHMASHATNSDNWCFSICLCEEACS